MNWLKIFILRVDSYVKFAIDSVAGKYDYDRRHTARRKTASMVVAGLIVLGFTWRDLLNCVLRISVLEVLWVLYKIMALQLGLTAFVVGVWRILVITRCWGRDLLVTIREQAKPSGLEYQKLMPKLIQSSLMNLALASGVVFIIGLLAGRVREVPMVVLATFVVISVLTLQMLQPRGIVYLASSNLETGRFLGYIGRIAWPHRLVHALDSDLIAERNTAAQLGASLESFRTRDFHDFEIEKEQFLGYVAIRYPSSQIDVHVRNDNWGLVFNQLDEEDRANWIPRLHEGRKKRDRWKQVVDMLMATCSVIVLDARMDGEAVRYEFGRLLERGLLYKSIFVVGDDDAIHPSYQEILGDGVYSGVCVARVEQFVRILRGSNLLLKGRPSRKRSTDKLKSEMLSLYHHATGIEK